jgi:DNA-binding CsgD family transcriptional regulator
MPVKDFYQTRFYREWAKPQDFVDFVSVVLDKSATETALFGVFRKSRHGLVDDEARRRVREIAPHLRRSTLIGRVIEQKTAEASSFAATLDGLSAAMFLVDASGRIVYANASGHELVANGAVVYASGGKLVSADKSAAQALNDIFVTAAEGDLALGTRGIFMPLAARDGERYAVHVLPLTSGARRATGNGYAAAAAVFVRKATIEVPSPPEVIARHYQLTPTELRVLLAIVQVGGVPETAEALGVGEATVKTHLHRVFGKTGAARQADLVKLVAGFANPLAN